ncbi:MAG: hypothetical protein ACOZCP_11145 [Pseudomonadota bacterium]
MSSWSCPHDVNDICQRVQGARCRPGMRGCVLEGRVVLASLEGQPAPKPQKAVPEKRAPAQAPRRGLPF